MKRAESSLALGFVAKTIEAPERIEQVIELEDYAVQTRYPGDYTPVDESEYLVASEVATTAMSWIRSEIK